MLLGIFAKLNFFSCCKKTQIVLLISSKKKISFFVGTYKTAVHNLLAICYGDYIWDEETN